MAQTITGLGIELATLVFPMVGMDHSGPVGLRKRLARSAWLTCMAHVPPLRIGREACGSAHDWARWFRAQGHDVRLIAPPCVHASVQLPTHEAREAEAIGKAVPRPPRRVVPITRGEPQDLPALHRIRARLINARPALVHAIRGLLRASGLVRPQRMATCRAWLVERLEADQAQRTARRTEVFWPLDEACLALETRLASADAQLPAMGQAHPACQRRQTIPGLGPVRATALIAALGAGPHVKHGRPWAAWLGWVPREHATGGTPRLLGISTRGHGSRRQWLMHGARATRRWVDTPSDDRRRWLRALMARRGKNRAAVAWAHTNARMVWALLAHHPASRVRTIVSTC
jgi:transposase